MRYVGIRNDLFIIEFSLTDLDADKVVVGELDHQCAFHLSENSITQCVIKDGEVVLGEKPTALYVVTKALWPSDCKEVKQKTKTNKEIRF